MENKINEIIEEINEIENYPNYQDDKGNLDISLIPFVINQKRNKLKNKLQGIELGLEIADEIYKEYVKIPSKKNRCQCCCSWIDEAEIFKQKLQEQKEKIK